MYKVILTTLLVLLANVGGWGACHDETRAVVGGWACRGLTCGYVSAGNLVCPTVTNGVVVGNNFNECRPRNEETCEPKDNINLYCYYKVCSTQCEADSTKGCDDEHIWNADSCKCVPKPPTESDSTFTICTESPVNGRVQATIYGVHCHYVEGTPDKCCGVSASLINGDGYSRYCPVVYRGLKSCSEAGKPNGPSPPQNCSGASCNMHEVPNPQECYATVGSRCYMRNPVSGYTYSCECDGVCAKAYQDIMSGQGCADPSPESSPSSSGSSGDSSGSSGDSSGSSGDSSGSGGGSDKDYTAQLNEIIANTQGILSNTFDISDWTQTTMNNTTDIKNQLMEYGIDFSHIRTNTENTAQNTSNIDNKLSTTNNLLQQIKDKDWSPDVHVNPNVTVVDSSKVELNVMTDTAKAPKEILDFLKGVLGGMDTTGNYNSSDTAGTGTREGQLIAHLDSQVNGGVPNMRDSIPHAVTGVKGALTGLKDSINNGPYGDSLAVWQNQLMNNGVITGNGSNDCPAPLRRSFSWDFGPKIGIVQLGTLRFICEDALGLGFSLWALARTLLRAMVAVCCMLWIYREVAGTGGSSNDED